MQSIDSLEMGEKVKNFIREIVSIILKYKKPERIYLFGSRSRNDNQKKSDIDIAIEAGNWPAKVKTSIRREVEDKIRTLLDIDLVWLDSVNKEFKKELLEKGVVVYEKRKSGL